MMKYGNFLFGKTVDEYKGKTLLDFEFTVEKETKLYKDLNMKEEIDKTNIFKGAHCLGYSKDKKVAIIIYNNEKSNDCYLAFTNDLNQILIYEELLSDGN